jgi:anti-anti-sigma regulatory factor
MSLTPSQSSSGYALGLTIGRDRAQVRIDGEIDIAAVPDLTRLMNSLDLLAYLPVEVDLSGVTFLDTFGVAPLVAAARRRKHDRLPPVLIVERSAAASYFLTVVELGGNPYLDLSAWDRVAGPPLSSVAVQRLPAPRLPAPNSKPDERFR